MKRHYWVLLFIVVLGLMSPFFTLRSEAYTATVAHPAVQSVATSYPDQVALLTGHSNIPTKYGDCIRIARRAGGDCLR